MTKDELMPPIPWANLGINVGLCAALLFLGVSWWVTALFLLSLALVILTCIVRAIHRSIVRRQIRDAMARQQPLNP